MSQTLELTIDGMTCADCVRQVTDAVQKLPGVHLLEVGIGVAKLTVDDEKSEQAALEAVRQAGYQPKLA